MRQAIITRYMGPTNHRSSRVKATASAGSVTVCWDHALGVDENHAAAAKALADKYGWGGVWVAGGLPNEAGNVYVDLLDGHAAFAGERS
jgi:hypothetical protein